MARSSSQSLVTQNKSVFLINCFLVIKITLLPYVSAQSWVAILNKDIQTNREIIEDYELLNLKQTLKETELKELTKDEEKMSEKLIMCEKIKDVQMRRKLKQNIKHKIMK